MEEVEISKKSEEENDKNNNIDTDKSNNNDNFFDNISSITKFNSPQSETKRALRSNSIGDKTRKKSVIVSLSGFDDDRNNYIAVETKLTNFINQIDSVENPSKFEHVYDNPSNLVVNAFNGDVFDFSIDCEKLNFNHLITPRSELRKCSILILFAIARGNLIVTDRWLDDSIMYKYWVPSKSGYRNQHYQFCPLSTEYKYQPVWNKSKSECINKLLIFMNWNIFIASSSRNFSKTVKLLLETAGATIINDFSNIDNKVKFILVENSDEFISWVNEVKF